MVFQFQAGQGFLPCIFYDPYQTMNSNIGNFSQITNNLCAQRQFYYIQLNDFQMIEQSSGSANFQSSTIRPLPQAHQASPSPHFAQRRPRIDKTLQNQIISSKKNSQPNILNQFYSYFSNRKRSEQIVKKCILLLHKSHDQTQKALSFFYIIIRSLICKKGRKYINTASFTKLFTSEELKKQLSEMNHETDNPNILTNEQLSQIIRRCANYFIKETSIKAILTSKRLSLKSKEEHLKRRRRILQIILNC